MKNRTFISLTCGLALMISSSVGLAQQGDAEGTGEGAIDRLPPPPLASILETGPETSADPDAEVKSLGPSVALAEIETYLQSLTSVQAKFILIAPNYRASHGTFSLKKPGRLRFDYDPPDSMLVVSDGKVLSLVDYDLRQVTRWPIKKTPLRPLVRSGEVFGEDVTVSRLIERGQQIRVTLAEAGDEDEGAMELVFARNPLRLEGWEIVDKRGQRTIIVLSNLQTNVPLEDALWTFDDPRPRRSRLPGKH